MAADNKITGLYAGLTSALTSFNDIHKAFVGPGLINGSYSVSGSGSGSGDMTMKTRSLRTFADQYTSAIALAHATVPECPFRTALIKFDKDHGTRLVSFANRWEAYLLKLTKDRPPTQAKKDKIIKELETLGSINVADFGYVKYSSSYNRQALGGNRFAQTLNTLIRNPGFTSAVFQPALKIINDGIKVHRSKESHDDNPYYFDKHLQYDDYQGFVNSALNEARNIEVAPLDFETVTWWEFASKVREIFADDNDFIESSAEAVQYLRTLAQVYTDLCPSLSETLRLGHDKATTLADGFRKGGVKDEVELSEKIKPYTDALRVLIAFVDTTRPEATLMSFDGKMRPVISIGQDLMTRSYGASSPSSSSGWAKATTNLSGSGSSASRYNPYDAKRVGNVPAKRGILDGSDVGFLSRSLDPDRVNECQMLAKNFDASVSSADTETADRLRRNTVTSLSHIKARIDELGKQDPESVVMQTDGLRKQQAQVVRSFVSRVRGAIARHRDRHAMFALRYNRGPLRYMSYWRDCGIPNLAQTTAPYFASLERATTKGEQEIGKIDDMLTGFLKDSAVFDGLTDKEIEDLIERSDAVHAFASVAKDDVKMVHSKPSTFLDQLVSDPHVRIIYLLKVVRYLLAWMAMSIATRAFSAIYASKVYVKNVAPPTPMLFLAMFFGVDAALNAGLLTVLWASSRMFKSPSNDFPIDSYLLSAWTVDVVCSELALAAVAITFAQIVATKKAFRYRQEGDRGIRALGQMMLYAYAVVLFVPFFRLI